MHKGFRRSLKYITRQYLTRRIDNIEVLRRELAAWNLAHNLKFSIVNWHFQTTDSRINLASLHPKYEDHTV